MWSCVLLFGLALFGSGIADTLCPDGWIAFQGSCYLFEFGNSLDFTDAEMFCTHELTDPEAEAHLVEINSHQENTFILNFLNEIKSHSWWIGLSDRNVELEFEWVGSRTEPTFTNWYPGQPHSSSGRDQDCILIQPDMSYMWNDVSCITKAFPICEYMVNMEEQEPVG